MPTTTRNRNRLGIVATLAVRPVRRKTVRSRQASTRADSGRAAFRQREPLTITFRELARAASSRYIGRNRRMAAISSRHPTPERRSTRPHDEPIPQQAALLAALGRRSVVLVGMMGAGKSSVGRRLAQRLGAALRRRRHRDREGRRHDHRGDLRHATASRISAPARRA